MLTVKDGLPQGYVSGMVQDAEGFIWMGTRDGLARYDGKNFKVFRSGVAGNLNSISSNVILSLALDRKNQIWILLETGEVDILDPVTEKFTHFTKESGNRQVAGQFTSGGIFPGSAGKVWFYGADNGVWVCDQANHKVRNFTKAHDALLSDSVRGVIEDHQKTTWLFMPRGVQPIDSLGNVGAAIAYSFNLNDLQATKNMFNKVVLGLHLRPCNQILIRENRRILIFDIDQQSFKTWPFWSENPILETPKTSPQVDSEGGEYIEVTGSVYKIVNDVPVIVWERTGFMHYSAFFIDRNDTFWYSKDATGLRKKDFKLYPFLTSTYTEGFFNTVFKYEFDYIPKIPQWISDGKINYFLQDINIRSVYDDKNRLWLTGGKNNGLVVNTADKTHQILPPVPVANKNHDFIYVPTAMDDQNRLWRMNSYTGNPVVYNEKIGEWYFPLGNEWRMSEEADIVNILVHSGKIWAVTEFDGMFMLDPPAGTVKWYNVESGFPTNELLTIVHDPKESGIIWVGSRNGLIKFDVNTETVRVYNERDGLPNNTIYCILPDHLGFLWFSTNKGLCRFDPQTGALETFIGTDGLQGDEFNRYQGIRLPDGRLAFGGTDGWTVLAPEDMKPDTYQPRVAFTKLKINNAEYVIDAKTEMAIGPLNSLQKLELHYDQNFINFEFAGLQYNNPLKIGYRYRLNNFDKDWVEVGNQNFANYTGLPPGKYVFEVNASNTSGIWSHFVRSMDVVIYPPWWATNLAYLGYGIMGIFAFFGMIRFGLHRAKLKQMVRIKGIEADNLRSIDDMKKLFFSNISHEFKTPLTIIKGAADYQLKNEPQQAIKDDLTLISQNAQRLGSLVNQLLELAKLESGASKLHLEKVNLNQAINSVLANFASEIRRKSLTVVYHQPDAQVFMTGDKEKLETVFLNLLSNAVKFSPVGGYIKISLSAIADEDVVQYSIADEGPGIASHDMDKIFTRFHQSSVGSHRASYGTGIGLSLCKDIATLHQGIIYFENNPEAGVTFRMQLPMGTTHFEALEATQLAYHDELNPMASLNGYTIPEVQLNEAPEPSNTPDGDKPLILIVEDHPELATILQRLLKNSYRTIHAPDGLQGAKMATEHVPNLIITDWMMPNMNGNELITELRQTTSTSHIPMIMLTAKSETDDKITSLGLGADDYLTKPFDHHELLARVAALIKSREMLQRIYLGKAVAPEAPPIEAREVRFLMLLEKLVKENVADENFEIAQLAENLKLSRSQLYRKVKALTGSTPQEYVLNIRLELALALLQEENPSTVSEISFQVGIANPSYFSKAFKKKYGIAPSAYGVANSG